MPSTAANVKPLRSPALNGSEAASSSRPDSSTTLENRYGSLIPSWLLRRWMVVESTIEREVLAFAASLPPGSRVLDAGAGEGRHRAHFRHCRYTGVDLAIGDERWDYRALDLLGDLSCLPFPADAFDAMLNIVVLEHTKRPAAVIAEMARTLRPGGRLLLVAPQEWEMHQQPHDYFRFTRFGLEWMLDEAGLAPLRLEPIGGYFTLLARRAMNSLNFFQSGVRWLLFPFVAILAAACGLVLPAFDFLDRDRNFTLAYVCVAEKK